MSNLFENNGALFSECRKYRYALWRIWDETKPLVMFIGLNPSTANETETDRTITRVRKFAFDWGHGGFYMMNLFAYVTPYPEVLKQCEDPLGDNDRYLKEFGSYAEVNRIIFAWGAFDVFGRDKQVKAFFPQAEALIINKDGSPRHPLYVKGDTKPIKIQ